MQYSSVNIITTAVGKSGAILDSQVPGNEVLLQIKTLLKIIFMIYSKTTLLFLFLLTKCRRLQDQTTPNHRKHPCAGFPGFSLNIEFGRWF